MKKMKATDISRVLATAPDVDVEFTFLNEWGNLRSVLLNKIEVTTVFNADEQASTRIIVNLVEDETEKNEDNG